MKAKKTYLDKKTKSYKKGVDKKLGLDKSVPTKVKKSGKR